MFVGRYRPVGERFDSRPGTLENFLTERYCLYTFDENFTAYRLEILHPPWPLQSAEAEVAVNTMANAAGVRLADIRPLLHFAHRQDMVVWPLTRL
jgi:uncharacterized protein YqjF (DUF2071 family)